MNSVALLPPANVSPNDFLPERMQSPPSKNILIIEDEQDVIDLLALHLIKDATFTISTATNGAAGVEKARRELPWMIILDLMLPKLSACNQRL